MDTSPTHSHTPSGSAESPIKVSLILYWILAVSCYTPSKLYLCQSSVLILPPLCTSFAIFISRTLYERTMRRFSPPEVEVGWRPYSEYLTGKYSFSHHSNSSDAVRMSVHLGVNSVKLWFVGLQSGGIITRASWCCCKEALRSHCGRPNLNRRDHRTM